MNANRNPMTTVGWLSYMAVAALLAAADVHGAEYFVTLDGRDDGPGTSREAAFRTIQKGVDALQPGDTLTIGPGEYFENVCRTNLGSFDADTVIRSEIPGAAVLRGDVPAPAFKKVDGYRFIYAAPFDQLPKAVLEHHNLLVMHPKANPAELEFDPGFYHYSTNSRTLYISNPDLTSPDQRRYTVAVNGNSGLELMTPRRVILEGLAATGFSPGWGILLVTPNACVVRDCVTYLNVGGINLCPTNGIGGNGGSNNVVEGCVSYGNSFAGVARYGANRDVIRNCHVYKNVHEGNENFGVIHYGGMKGPLLITNNISWGHSFNYSVKPGYQQERLANNVGLGYIRMANLFHNLIGGGNEYDRSSSGAPAHNILFLREQNLDRDFEFADPLNLDFRLQPDARFRGTAPDGTDRGPYPYAANVFYLAPGGDDQADGLSMRKPWRTLERALKALRPGDTLYLAEGEYAAVPWNKAGDGRAPIRICGRGRGTVVIKGRLSVTGGAGIMLERLNFPDGVALADCRGLTFRNCTFFGQADGLTANAARDLTVTHCVFAGVPIDLKKAERATLSGNVYANAGKPAVRLDAAAAVRYSDCNSYQDAKTCWQVSGAVQSLTDLQPRHDRYAHVLTPEFVTEQGVPRLKNEALFKGLGPHSTTLGVHHDYQVAAESMDLVGPFLHSANDTTANIEWWSSHPATYAVAWGETPDMTNVIGNLNGPERFNTFSLTGLKPGRIYYFAIRSATATVGDGAQPLPVLKPEKASVTFTTAATAAAPKTYYVSPDGDDSRSGLSREQALRTVNRAATQVGPGDTVLIAGGAYAETVRIRAAGTQDRPITFRALPGEKPFFKGENVTLVFQVVSKPDNRFDGLYFDAGFWDKVMVIRQSPRVHVTRCLNAMMAADQSPGMLVRNCIVRGGWSGLGLSRSPDSLVENNVFIMTILRHLTCDSPAIARNNIFCECIRNKAHQTLLELSASVAESNNCFYVRWPQDEKLAINWRPLTEYRVRTGSNAFAANPMMPGTPGWSQGWQHSKVQDFPDCYAANPDLVRRGIGLQPEAFRDFQFKTNWVYDRAWAETVIARTNAVAALVRAGKDAEAVDAYTNLVAALPLPDRLKADLLERASLCAGRLKNYELALKLAADIPVQPISMYRQMQLLLEQGRHADVLARFTQKPLGGRSFHTSYAYPELEDLMAELYYLRSLAYIRTNDLAAAEADLRIMNDKRTQLQYRSGEAIHDLVWLRLGNFYRDQLKDDTRAYDAYTNITDRTTWTYWGRPRKPAARGGDETLVTATKAVSDLLRKRGREADIPALQFNLLVAQAEAATSVLKTNDAVVKFKEALALPGRTTAGMNAVAGRIRSLAGEVQKTLIGTVGTMAAGLTDDSKGLLIRAAVAGDPQQRDAALLTLLLSAPLDKVTELLDKTVKEEREKATRAQFEPVVKRLGGLVQARQWQALVDEFKATDFAAWEDRSLAGEAFLLRGQAYFGLKDGPRAEADLAKVLEILPGNQTAMFYLAENYQSNLSDPKKALAAYLRLHQAAGVHYGWISLDAALKSAALLRAQGRPDEALQILRKYDPEKAAGTWRGHLIDALKSPAP